MISKGGARDTTVPAPEADLWGPRGVLRSHWVRVPTLTGALIGEA